MINIKNFILKKNLRHLILKYYKNLPEEEKTDELKEVINFLKRNPVRIFPYKFINKYKSQNIDVLLDKELNIFYTIYEGKRMYYKNHKNKRKAKKYFASVIMEQDRESPHLYLSKYFNIKYGDIVADVGAAEGIFGLKIIDKVSKLYLFEPNTEWHEALLATYKPWLNKIEIVPKMISDSINQNCVTLDHFFEKRPMPDFIKVDVDGSELKVLNGTKKIIENHKTLKIAICTYHYQDDAEILSKFLMNRGCSISFSKGYMIYRVAVKKPYLRRGVLRAEKTHN